MAGPSRSDPVDLVTEQLLVADLGYGLVIRAQELAVEGRQSDALAALKTAASAMAAARPVLRGAIAGHRAERQAAQAGQLTQRTLAPFFPGKPEEEPHAANDHATTPQQPSPSVA